MKKAISALLSVAMAVGLLCAPVLGVQSDLYDDSGGHTAVSSNGGVAGDGGDIPESGSAGGYVTCPHGKVKGESCAFCGELAHSGKNIPLIGYEQEFFDQVDPGEDEGWSLYTIRLVCEHGIADGVYCGQCGKTVDVDGDGLPRCAILDSCVHGRVAGEKCQECQTLKEEQGDYELTEGEAWNDPLIYATEPMMYVSDISYIFNQNRYCKWCDNGSYIGVSRLFGDAWNVHCHKDSNGKYHWDYIDHVEGSGTCESHTTTIVYRCGAREKAQSHSHSCTYNGAKHEHSAVIAQPTCVKEGRRQTYYTQTCVNCGTESSAMGVKSYVIPKLDHIATGCVYADSDDHQIECSGNGTGAHSFIEAHSFEANGEDFECTGCGAVKTTVHVDAYSTDGNLVKSDLMIDTVEVGHNGPKTVSVQDYLKDAAEIGMSCNLYPAADQPGTASVQVGGIHLKYYTISDTAAPTVVVTQNNGVATIKAYDDLSGLKEITYFGRTASVADPLRHIGEENGKEIYHYVNGFASGTYQITVTDYAGNSYSYDIVVNADDPIDESVFSMYVPSAINFSVDKEGTVTYSPEDAKIYNGSTTRSIYVKEISVDTLGEWQLVDYGTDFSQYEKDSPYVAMSINGEPVSVSGTVTISEEDWIIEADGTLDLILDIKVPEQTESRELPDVLKINFTGDWYPAVEEVTPVLPDTSGWSKDVLLAPLNTESKWPCVMECILDPNGYTWTCKNDFCIEIESTGKLLLGTGNGGVIKSRYEPGVKIKSGGELWIADQDITVSGIDCSLYVEPGAKVHLSGGTYSGIIRAIYVEDGNYAGLLAPGYAFFDTSGNIIAPAEAENLRRVIVKPRQ